MNTAYQATEEDVANVLSSNPLVNIDSGETVEAMAHRLLPLLDFEEIENAALYGDSMDQQSNYANDEIARQLRVMGVLQPISIDGDEGDVNANSSVVNMPKTTMEQRAESVNQFLQAVASCGRKFFRYGDQVAKFNVAEGGRVTYQDNYTQKLIKIKELPPGKDRPSKDWVGFSHGGNLRDLVVELGQFIHTGKAPHLNLGPWTGRSCLWAYGDDMDIVRAAAEVNGLRPQKLEPADVEGVTAETPKG